VGSIRNFLAEIQADLDSFELPADASSIRIATGTLGARVFERYVFPLLTARGMRTPPEILVVKNEYFGAGVTCSGLLVGRDIADSVKQAGSAKTTFIPPNCLNYDGVTIDEMSVDDLAKETGAPVVAPTDSFVESLCDHSASGFAT